jgi:hypothetical protein
MYVIDVSAFITSLTHMSGRGDSAIVSCVLCVSCIRVSELLVPYLPRRVHCLVECN